MALILNDQSPIKCFVYQFLEGNMQAYVDAVLDLASHFITRLRRYASFCRTLASHAVTAGTGGSRNMVTGPTQSSASPAAAPGPCALHYFQLYYVKTHHHYALFIPRCSIFLLSASTDLIFCVAFFSPFFCFHCSSLPFLILCLNVF